VAFENRPKRRLVRQVSQRRHEIGRSMERMIAMDFGVGSKPPTFGPRRGALIVARELLNSARRTPKY
jgi:hypothetical protein